MIRHTAIVLAGALMRRAVGGLLVLLLLGAVVASTSGALHHLLHNDHRSATHYCLVSLLEHGHGHMADTTSVCAEVIESWVWHPASVPDAVASHEFILLPVRGPPVLS